MNEFVHVMYTCVLMCRFVIWCLSHTCLYNYITCVCAHLVTCSPHCRPSPVVGKRNRATLCSQQARKTHDVHVVLCYGLTHSTSLFTACTAC